MLVIPAVTVLCTAGVVFYLRFLVALCKECKPRRVGYWLRLRIGASEDTIAELQEHSEPATRVA